jgi:uncharacterized protein
VSLSPVHQDERIHSVDALRGFSLLGILLLNIVSFGLPFAAYMNPTVAGGSTGLNFATWLTAATLWDGKMRCIFSMLFGTGALILLERAERRGAGIEAADIYFRRTLWLILFGLLHAHFIWAGDILYSYGVVGLLIFPFRKLSAQALIRLGAIIILVHCLQNGGAAFGIGELAQAAGQSRQLEAAGKKLTTEQKKTLDEWTTLQSTFAPTKEEVAKEIQTHRSGWLPNLALRSSEAIMMEFTMFFQAFFLDVLGMLILGMGLAKAGVFDASRSIAFYLKLIAAGLFLGVPLNYWAARSWAQSGFGIPEYFGYLGTTADPGRFLVAGAYVGFMMIACKLGWRWLTVPLANVGRMALSNYLLTSILCTLFFNGYGLGFYAKLQRIDLYLVVLAVWIINIVWSTLWLRHYRYGPAEWMWRSLTYWQRQPMLRA